MKENDMKNTQNLIIREYPKSVVLFQINQHGVEIKKLESTENFEQMYNIIRTMGLKPEKIRHSYFN